MAAHRTVRLRPLTRSERRVLKDKLRDLSLPARIHQRYRVIAEVAAGRRVAEAAERAGADARFEPSRPEVGRRVYEALRPGDVVLTLGAGDITRVAPELVRWLGAA